MQKLLENDIKRHLRFNGLIKIKNQNGTQQILNSKA